jgi:hypothetical protein
LTVVTARLPQTQRPVCGYVLITARNGLRRLLHRCQYSFEMWDGCALNRKSYARKRPWPILRNYPGIYQNSLCMNQKIEIRHLEVSDSSVGIATSYGLDDRGAGVRVLVGSRIFSTSSTPALGSTQPPIQWVPRVISPGVKWPGRETEHSPLTSA